LSSADLDIKQLASAIYSNLYSDVRYKNDKNVASSSLKSITLRFPDPSPPADISSTFAAAAAESFGSYLTRDIVNSPPNVLNPHSLAALSAEIVNSCPEMTLQVLEADECEKRGMGAFLGVSRGSETLPKFIHITYKPASPNPNAPKLACVGKGLTFDSGGLNIKLAMMELMKFDCGGSAAVLGTARAIAQIKPDVEVHFIVASCENSVSAKAMRPGDILTASNGKTIEVLNTDAEGRLTLADALVYADKTVQADKICELSTLTGACMISLGEEVAGLWTHDDALAESLSVSSKSANEEVWRMPLVASYNEGLKSKIADLGNMGGKYGGAITAALFLQNFVTRGKPFAHIDIAGPVWKKDQASGFGSKLLVEWIMRESKATK
jgi:leucyl aminopeptidase